MINITQYGAGVPVVLVHGWGFDGRMWQAYVEQLRLSCRVYVVDLPCFGQSDCIDDFDQMITALKQRLPAQAMWVGWSLGAQVAMRMLVDGFARQVIALAALPVFVEKSGFTTAMSQSTFDDFVRAVNKSEKIGRKIFTALVEQGGQMGVGELLSPMWLASEKTLAWLATLDLSEVQIVYKKTRFLLADQDVLVPIHAKDTLIQRGAQVTVFSGGHSFVFEQIEVVVQTIMQSLNEK